MIAAPITAKVNLDDVLQVPGILQNAPQVMSKVFVPAFRSIKAEAVRLAREDMAASLHIRSRGTLHAISGDYSKQASRLEDLSASVYSRSKLMEAHDKGGPITGHGKQLTILFELGRGANGKRRYTQSELRHAIADGTIKLVPTPRGVLLVESGTTTKGGKWKGRGFHNKSMKGFGMAAIGILKRGIVLPKRTHFYATEERIAPKLDSIISQAAEQGLQKIAGAK